MRYMLCLPWIILMLVPVIVRWRAVARENRIAEEAAQLAAQREADARRKRDEAERRKAVSAAKAAQREAAKAEREAGQQRRRDEKLAQARELAELRERALDAARELKALERAGSIPAGPEPKPVELKPVELKPVAPKRQDNGAFAGQVVAFTGRLPGMTRREAIQAVRDNGGRAYEKMPAGTTLLVVGDRPGMCKLDKADEWIGQVRKITAAQFFEMLGEGETIEFEAFAERMKARWAV